MRAVDIIAKKRDGKGLSTEEIEFFVGGFTRGEIPDYQASAWAMAVLLQGMDHRETVDLTMCMARSGDVLDLSGVAPLVVDKHSTGGVGDKTTLAVAPIVASLGLPVGKMSGRGLGFSGGTLDKLESISGYRCDLGIEEFLSILEKHGIVVSGQTADLAPADGKLYGLRDATATVPSLPLIASSVMSKKIAAGANAIVLDVKVGRGAFMKTVEDALALGKIMAEIGRRVGRRVTVVVSDMNQPLGSAVGNALEVREALHTLRGEGPCDFVEHCAIIAAHMLVLGGVAADADAGREMSAEAIGSGKALAKFREWIEAQGGDLRVIDDESLLPRADCVRVVGAPQAGYLAVLDAMEVGLTSVQLGGGRKKKGDTIDHSVGIVVHLKVGDQVARGEPLFTVHARNEEDLQQAVARLLAACEWSDEPVEPLPLFHEVILG
jgi:pyrimidine-nucleoside phosphorylase